MERNSMRKLLSMMLLIFAISSEANAMAKTWVCEIGVRDWLFGVDSYSGEGPSKKEALLAAYRNCISFNANDGKCTNSIRRHHYGCEVFSGN